MNILFTILLIVVGFIAMVWLIEGESLTIEYRKLTPEQRKKKLAEFWSKR